MKLVIFPKTCCIINIKKEYKGWGLMKDIFKVAIFTFLLSCLFTQEVTYAHPGRTDEDGGHTCYTNCEDWGLDYEEYHYHDELEEEEYVEPEEQEDDSDITVIDPFAPLGALLFIGGILYWLFGTIRDWWEDRR